MLILQYSLISCPVSTAAEIVVADEEFPASGKLLLDASADHYLMIEDAVTAGQILIEKLVGVF